MSLAARVAKSQHWNYVCFFSDAKQVVESISRKDDPARDSLSTVHKLLEIADCIGRWSCKWINRTLNYDAHDLCNLVGSG